MAKDENEDKEEEEKKKKRKDFLIKLKEKINKSKEFVCNYPTDKEIIKKEFNFIWVGTPDGLIGTDECHYEILFYDNDTLHIEAHFEDDNFKDFHDIELPEKTKEKLEYKKDLKKKQGEIVYANDTGIANTGNTESKIKEVMDRLKELDGLIGAKLRRIVCAQRNYVILKVNDTHYKKYKNFPILSTALFVAACVVGVAIIQCCLSFNIVGTVGLLMLAAFLFVLSVIIMLETDDERWIRSKLKNSVVDSMNGKKLTKENCKILMDIMEL